MLDNDGTYVITELIIDKDHKDWLKIIVFINNQAADYATQQFIADNCR